MDSLRAGRARQSGAPDSLLPKSYLEETWGGDGSLRHNFSHIGRGERSTRIQGRSRPQLGPAVSLNGLVDFGKRSDAEVPAMLLVI